MTAQHVGTQGPLASLGTASGARRSLWLLLAFAPFLRLLAIGLFPSLHHPDEAFQLFEPAHRIAFGWGVSTWEFEDGIRSYVPPALLAAVFRLAEPLVGGPTGYILAARVAVAFLSLLPVYFIARAGERESRAHALLGGLVAATWFEIVYFSFRPLTEALACDFALTALALATPTGRALTTRTLVGLGLCLALTVLLRLQLAPGAALIALAVCGLDIRRRWLPLLAGAAPALLLFGAADWLTWGEPFASYARAVAENLGAGKASAYGVKPWNWYLFVVAANWGPFAFPVIGLAALRWRRSWLWIAFAAVELAVHSAIPHKEYRFVFPALAALVVVAAFGSADLVTRFGPRVRHGALLPATASAWLLASLALAASPHYRPQWFASRGILESEAWLARQPGLCGVLFYDAPWFSSGGYAFFHRRAPVYFPQYSMKLSTRGELLWPPDTMAHRQAAVASTEAFNYVVLAPASLSRFQPGYRLARCFRDAEPVCVARRLGGCTVVADLRPILTVPRLGEPEPSP